MDIDDGEGGNKITFPTSFASMGWPSGLSPQALTRSWTNFSSTACGNTRFSTTFAPSSNPMLLRPRMFSNFFSQLPPDEMPRAMLPLLVQGVT